MGPERCCVPLGLDQDLAKWFKAGPKRDNHPNAMEELKYLTVLLPSILLTDVFLFFRVTF